MSDPREHPDEGSGMPRPAAAAGAASVTVVYPSLDELRAEAMEWGRKPRGRGTWYVTEHMVRAMRAYGWTIVVGALGQPILYLLGLAVGLAALIEAPVDDRGMQVPYLVFVAPALLMTASISVASEEFTYPVMAGFKWRRYFFGFSSSALSSPQIAAGVVIGAASRMLLTVGLYYLFIWIFFAWLQPEATSPETAWLMIPIGVLAGLSFGIPLMAYAASLEDDKGQFALVQRFVFMPMFLFSGTLYPITVYPEWVQKLVMAFPLWHGVELVRGLTTGVLSPAMLWHVLYYVVMIAVGLVFTTKRLRALFLD